MTQQPGLADKMRDLAAKRSDLPTNWLETAEAFEAATKGFYGEPQTVDVRKFMGCWARARKMWCAATGDSLV
jgi:hypothetical protein